MRFLVYTPVTEETLRERLGTAEYSYFFVMKGYLPVLESLGEVVQVRDPQSEADVLYRQAKAEGEDARLICFCPPNLAPVGLECPTTVVVAWEFDSLPTEPWGGDERNDWRTVLADHSNVITLSTHSREAVGQAMGSLFPTTAIPVPVFDRIANGTTHAKDPIAEPVTLHVKGRVVDSRQLDITDDRVELRDPMSFCWQTWDGSSRTISFEFDGEGQQYLLGFYIPEPWGAWSRISEPSIMLPFALSGRVQLQLTAVSYGRNVGRMIDVVVGSSTQSITLSAEPQTYKITVAPDQPTNLIGFRGLDASAIPGAADIRTMGIGLVSLKLKQKPRLPWRRGPAPVPMAQPREYDPLDLSGVVYTSVFNPQDGRKNWFDIITAFCHALRDRDDATLVLKMTHHSIGSFLADLLSNLRVIGPTHCRVVAVHGYLDDDDFETLMNSTSYYVNASHGEGLCLPLMEFMSAGVPAVAPDHTAMADYVDERTTFVVGSGPLPTQWPNDPTGRIRTLYCRIDWTSLVTQFQESYRVATTDVPRYREMSATAIDVQRAFSSDAQVAALLSDHLTRVGSTADADLEAPA
jgi:hypothetical protein